MTNFEIDNFDNYVPTSKNVSLLLRPSFHTKKKGKRQRKISQTVKRKPRKAQIVIFKLLKLFLKRNILEVEENTKVKFP